MKATLPTAPKRNAKNLSGDKEISATYNAVAYDRTRDIIKTYVTAHVYRSRSGDGASPRYASVWVYPTASDSYTSGHGKATGYGYHKPSAAMQAAITSAGITLTESIDGRGDGTIESALRAIAIAAGADPVTVTII